MKKFYDRAQEMAQLKELQKQSYSDYTRFVVLTGRRRVGKTIALKGLSMRDM